jgi:hypothetical protein
MSTTRVATLFDELPEFEGVKPVGTELTFGGGSGRRTRAMRIGERIVLVVEVAVTGVEHKETKGGQVRVHKLRVEDAYELGDNRAPDLLEMLHDEYQAAEDEARGRAKLPFDEAGDGTDGQTAAAGAGPEARADAREQGDGWDEFDEGQPDATALLALNAAAEVAVEQGTHADVSAFLAEVEQYAHDAGLVEVPLGDVPPPADAPEEGGTVSPLRPTKKAAPVKKAAKKSTPSKS